VTHYARIALVLVMAFALAGAGRSRSRRAAQPRATPAQTLTWLKRAVARRDHASEWRQISPGFKKRLNEQAGRVVDEADYTAFRQAQRRNPEIRKLERYLRQARVTGVRYFGDGRARVTIRFGGPLFFGADLRVVMIHHELWRIDIVGESQPYIGFKGDRSLSYTKSEDGSYTITGKDRTGNITFQETFTKEQVRGFRKFTKWFFHDFGQAESQFLNIAG